MATGDAILGKSAADKRNKKSRSWCVVDEVGFGWRLVLHQQDPDRVGLAAEGLAKTDVHEERLHGHPAVCSTMAYSMRWKFHIQLFECAVEIDGILQFCFVIYLQRCIDWRALAELLVLAGGSLTILLRTALQTIQQELI